MNTFNGVDVLLIFLCIAFYWMGYMRAKRVTRKIRDAEMDTYFQDYFNQINEYK